MEISDFGKELIRKRKAKGLTQDEVAEMCNITVRTIQRIESGSSTPRAFTIKKISEVLGFNYFDSLNTGYKVSKTNDPLHVDEKIRFWSVKNLFNLKKDTVKKVSILTTASIIVITSVRIKLAKAIVFLL